LGAVGGGLPWWAAMTAATIASPSPLRGAWLAVVRVAGARGGAGEAVEGDWRELGREAGALVNREVRVAVGDAGGYRHRVACKE